MFYSVEIHKMVRYTVTKNFIVRGSIWCFEIITLAFFLSLSLSFSLRIIEVEPSVNIESGQNADIVQVLDNKIIGRRTDQPVLSPDHIHSGGSRENSPFTNNPPSGRHHSPSPSTGSATSKCCVRVLLPFISVACAHFVPF